MQNRDVVRALLWAAVAFFAWQWIAVVIWPPQPLTPQEPVADSIPPDDTAPPTETADGSPKMTKMPAGESQSENEIQVVADKPQTVRLGDTTGGMESEFRMALTLTNVGASVVSCDLSDFTDSVGPDALPYPMLTEKFDPDGVPIHAFTTESVYVRDEEISLANVPWTVMESTPEHALFSVDLTSDDVPILRILQRYEIERHTHKSMRHDLRLTTEIINLSREDESVIITRRGPIGVRKEDPRFDDRGAFFATYEGDVVTAHSDLVSRIKDERTVYDPATSMPLVWTALGNKYFVAFETPLPSAASGELNWIRDVKRIPVNTNADHPKSVIFQTTTVPLKLAAGQSRSLPTEIYLGPKSKKAFSKVPFYKQKGYERQVLASYSIGPCAFMTFSSLTSLMIWLLNMLKSVVFNYGIAIIILVLCVRTLLHPITKKGQVNMMRMQQQMGTLGPKVEELKKRFANDKVKLNQETMKLYQEAGVNPATGMLSSCVPMFLQMPIWIALYTSLNYNIDMRHEPFVLWIRDLSAPDALIRFAQPVNVPLISLMTGPIRSFNLLPILVSAAMFAQQKLMPKPKPPEPTDEKAQQAAQMQKMMPFMTLFFGLLFYSMPSGLNLYIGASSFFGMIEQKRIRKHIDELKEKKPEPKVAKKPTTKKGLSFFERLQKAAEEAQKVKSSNPKKKAPAGGKRRK